MINTNKKWSLIILSLSVLALLLIGTFTLAPTYAQGPRDMMGQTNCNQPQFGNAGPGWMMGYQQAFSDSMPFGGGMMNNCQSGFSGMMVMF